MPETIQTHGKRRAPRYYLGGVVELTDLDADRQGHDQPLHPIPEHRD